MAMPCPATDIVDALPPISSVVPALMEALQSEDFEPNNIEKLLLSEPVLCGGILHLANSSFFGFNRNVNSIREACIVLGKQNIFNVVCASNIVDAMSANNNEVQQQFYTSIWKHCLYSGCLITNMEELSDRDDLFLAALFQYLGLIALNYAHPEFIQKLHSVGHSRPFPVNQINRYIEKEFGVSLFGLTSEIMHYWRLPVTICEKSSRLDGCSRTSRLLGIANVVSSSLGYRPAAWILENPVNAKDFDRLFCDQTVLKTTIEKADEQFIELTQVLPF